MGLFSFLTGKSTAYWAQLTVIDKTHLSADFAVFTLQKNPKDQYNPTFIPGQYVTLEIELGGNKIRRSYSICGKAPDGFKIGVKRVNGGLMSNYLHDSLHKGSSIKAHIPEGNFTLNGAHTVCAFVAGSGITPIASMIEAFDEIKQFRVFYGIRYASDLVFQDLLNQVNTTIYLSQEEKDGFKRGRLNYDALMEEFKADLSILQRDIYLLCGPEDFMNEVERGLLFFGVPESKIKREYFTPPVKEAHDGEAQQRIQGPVLIKATIDGISHDVAYQSGKKSILEALEEAKLDPPYSCRGGVCSSCKAKVTEGKVSMRQNFTLTDKEIEAGYILTCQADACTSQLSISFDE